MNLPHAKITKIMVAATLPFTMPRAATPSIAVLHIL